MVYVYLLEEFMKLLRGWLTLKEFEAQSVAAQAKTLAAAGEYLNKPISRINAIKGLYDLAK